MSHILRLIDQYTLQIENVMAQSDQKNERSTDKKNILIQKYALKLNTKDKTVLKT